MVINNTTIEEKPLCRFEKWWGSTCEVVKDNNHAYPCFLGIPDLQSIIDSQCIFGRKFDAKLSIDLYRALQLRFAEVDGAS